MICLDLYCSKSCMASQLFAASLAAVSVAMLGYASYFTSRRSSVMEKFESGYDVMEIRGFLRADQCNRLVQQALGSLEQSQVIGADSSVVSDVRTSTQAWFHRGDAASDGVQDILDLVHSKASRISDISDLSHYEALQVARYEPGQQYKPHFDACLTEEKCPSKNRINRKMTVLIYLNDDFQGGGTHFPSINKIVAPEKGKAVIFFNTTDDGAAEEPLALHAGLPVTSGEKWIANQWIRWTPIGSSS